MNIICPFCQIELKLNLGDLAKQAGKIGVTPCPNCEQKMYSGLVIVTSSSPQTLMASLKNMGDALVQNNKKTLN